jgi:outer membrane lipoprotein SlyB
MKAMYALLLALVLSLSGCATAPQAPPDIRQGKIEQISSVSIPTDHHVGLGAIVGGAAGSGIGSLIGGGSGRDVAIAVGAIGGTIAGADVAKHYSKPEPGQQIIVRLNSGVLVAVTQPVNPALRVGQQVYVVPQ